MDESRMTSAVAQDDEATDRELIDQARSGQWDAQDTLARRHRQGAFVLALQMLGNRDDAMDVAQDAMLRFFTTLDSFNRDRRVSPGCSPSSGTRFATSGAAVSDARVTAS